MCSSNKEIYKSYIVNFTCAVTPNAHLDRIVGEFIISFKKIYSTKRFTLTFISENFKTLKSKEIKRLTLKLKINWRFIL